MKKNYNLDDFEAFLSDSADQYRMYPSDRVWRNIDKELHGQKKWPALTFGALLTGAIITAGLILIHPDKNLLQIDPQQQSASQKKLVKSHTEHPASTSNSNIHKNIIEALASNETNANSASNNQSTVGYNDFNAAAAVGLDRSYVENDLVSTAILNGSDELEAFAPLSAVRQTDLQNAYPNAGIAPQSVEVSDDITDGITNVSIAPASLAIAEKSETNKSLQQMNENKKKSRWSMEYYVTPSYSYRYLTESKITDLHQSQQQNGPIAPNLINPVNNFVSHKPTLGVEAGAGIVYQLTPKLQVKAGLQFNMRGYIIDAYASTVEPSTIVLNRGYYTDSIMALSFYNTQSGYKEASIENRYWEVAIPIGINYQVTNGKKVNLSIAASAQPTYQFNNSEYILSHDYRNYVQEPSLVRKWNLNTAIGAIISYDIKAMTLQAGPQIRYQVLPGTVSEYPIREHLLDYGFRIGVVKTLK